MFYFNINIIINFSLIILIFDFMIKTRFKGIFVISLKYVATQ